jgi:hypothetical protein
VPKLSAVLKLLSVASCLVAAAIGQVKPEPIKPEPTTSPLTDPLMSTSLLPLVAGAMAYPEAVRPHIMVGQFTAEVTSLLGDPNGRDIRSDRDGRKGNFIWYYNGHGPLLKVTFRGGKVTRVQEFTPRLSAEYMPISSAQSAPTSETLSAPSTPSKAERAVGVAVDIAARLALTNVCPNVYRKPLLFMNANDLLTRTGSCCLGCTCTADPGSRRALSLRAFDPEAVPPGVPPARFAA